MNLIKENKEEYNQIEDRFKTASSLPSKYAFGHVAKL